MTLPITCILSDPSIFEALDGTNYKRQSQKLLILLEQLEVNYVMYTVPPIEFQKLLLKPQQKQFIRHINASSRKENAIRSKLPMSNHKLILLRMKISQLQSLSMLTWWKTRVIGCWNRSLQTSLRKSRAFSSIRGCRRR